MPYQIGWVDGRLPIALTILILKLSFLVHWRKTCENDRLMLHDRKFTYAERLMGTMPTI